MKDTDLVDIVKIVDSLKDIKKGDQGEPLRFEDLTPEQIKSLTGKQGDEGPRGPVGPRWEFSDLTKEQRNELTLKFSHLTEQDKDELKLRWEHLTQEEIESLKLRFKHLTKEDKEELRLKFEDLTEANKKEIKGDKGDSLKFSDLTKTQKKEIEGKKGDKGDKGDDGLSVYELAVKNGFKGTEAQWLATLKGRDGKDGKSIQVTEQAFKKHKHSTGDITGLDEKIQDVIGNSLVEGTNITIDYDDITGETTINSTGGGGGVTDGDKGDITISGGGTTRTIDDGVVTESKLSVSVNDSLNLADTSLQPGDNISELVNDAGYTTNTGTVTSVAISGTDGIEIDSGSPVTTTGTIALGVNKTAMLTHLNVEDGAEVNNISDVDATDLTDGGTTTLHNHDSRYYTETEVDTLLNTKQPDIQFKDEGINAGTSGGVTIVDFVGAGVTASESAGTLTVTIPGGGGSPGGVDTDVQYNDGGVFNGGVLKYNKTTKTYTLVDTSAGSGLQVISGNTTGPYGEIDTTNGSGMIGGRYVDLNAFTATYRFKSGVYPSFHTLELKIQHTADRTIYVPDADGTLALTSDLGAYSTFVALTDTPASYTGEAGKVTAVNGTEDGLEFIDIPTTSPGGTVNEIQFNNAGVFGSVPGFSRDGIDLIFAYPGGDTYMLYMQDAIQMTTGTLSLGALDNKIRLYGPGLSIDLALDTSDITASRNQLLQDRDGYIALTNIKVEANTDGSGSPNIITGAESSTLFTNEGSTAKNYHTLPTAVAGLTYTFYVADSDGIRVVADTGNFILVNGVSSTSAGYCDSTSIGSSITLTAINATDWVATSSIGTRTLG